MKKKLNWICIIIIIFFAVFAIGSSSSETGITGLKFSWTSTIDLDVGESKSSSYFTVSGNDKFSLNDIEFISTSPEVATFSYDKTTSKTLIYYKIKALSPGETRLYVQTKDGIVKSDDIIVRVHGRITTDDKSLTSETKLTSSATVLVSNANSNSNNPDIAVDDMYIDFLDGNMIFVLKGDYTCILGAPKEDVNKLLTGFKVTENYIMTGGTIDNPIMYPYSIKFENENMMICVDFNEDWIAEGVYVETYVADDPDTGEGSYVYENYDTIVKLIIGHQKIKVQNDTILYNSSGTKKYPTAIFVGKLYGE